MLKREGSKTQYVNLRPILNPGHRHELYSEFRRDRQRFELLSVCLA